MELSQGTLSTIMTGGQVDTPIMQILGSKKISGAGDNERYRLLVSDGVHVNSFAMLATQLNEKIRNGDLSDNTIVRIKRYITSVVPNSGKGEKRVMIILDVEVVAPGSKVGGRIGNPQSWSVDGPAPAATPAPAPTPKVEPKEQYDPPMSCGVSSASMNGSAAAPYPQLRPSPQKQAPVNHGGFGGGFGNNIRSPNKGMGGMELHPNMHVNPIVSLTPYQNKWAIKARVLSKTNVRTWSNSKGEGKLFSFDLADDTGEIRVTAFRDQCDKFYDMIEIGKVYILSKGQVKAANKKFSSLNNDYELTLGNESQILPVHDEDTSIPQIKFNFVPLSEIESMENGTNVDIIGVAKSTNDLYAFTSKTTNKDLKKREVTVVDKSNTAVTVTLWGQLAEDFDGSSQPVVAMKGGRINEFGGAKSVSAPGNGTFQINPDIPEAHQLKGWFDAEGANANFKSISARSGAGGGMDNSLITLKEARDRNLGSSGNDYYNCKASVIMIKSENALYNACPAENCNKKVIDHQNGMYRCEKCNREYPNYKPRLLLQMNVGDWSDNSWITLFQDQAEVVLGHTAEILDDYKINNLEAYQQVFQQATFKSFTFRLRAQVQTYNDEQRLRTTGMVVKKIDHKAYCASLLSQLKELSGMGTVAN